MTPGIIYDLFQNGVYHPYEQGFKILKYVSGRSRPVYYDRNQNEYVMKIRICKGCGELAFGNIRTITPFCRKCNLIIRKKNKWKSVKTRKNDIKNDHLRDVDRWDCKMRDLCLEKYQYYTAVPCKGCKEYDRNQKVNII